MYVGFNIHFCSTICFKNIKFNEKNKLENADYPISKMLNKLNILTPF